VRIPPIAGKALMKVSRISPISPIRLVGHFELLGL
jgi:hypothetical protein